MTRVSKQLMSKINVTNNKTQFKRVLTDQEASIYIGMGVSWLRHGRIIGTRFEGVPYPPFIKIGRSVRYLIEDLDCWLEQFKKLDNLAQLVSKNNAKDKY